MSEWFGIPKDYKDPLDKVHRRREGSIERREGSIEVNR